MQLNDAPQQPSPHFSLGSLQQWLHFVHRPPLLASTPIQRLSILHLQYDFLMSSCTILMN